VSGSLLKNNGYRRMQRVVRRRRVEVRDQVEKKDVMAASRSEIGCGEGEGMGVARRDIVAVDMIRDGERR
jgi:hypothetical protein